MFYTTAVFNYLNADIAMPISCRLCLTKCGKAINVERALSVAFGEYKLNRKPASATPELVELWEEIWEKVLST